MAAYIFIDKTNPNKCFTWYVGQSVHYIKEHLKEVYRVQVDGHEAQMLYGINMDLDGKYVHNLEGNEAKQWALLITKYYRNATDWKNAIDRDPEQIPNMPIAYLIYLTELKFKKEEDVDLDEMREKIFRFAAAKNWDMISNLLID